MIHFFNKQNLLVWASGLLLTSAASAACHFPDASLGSNDDKQNKQSCLAESSFVVTPPDAAQVNILELLQSPKASGLKIANDSVVYCRFHPQKQNGASSKFRCVRTNEKNQLYNSKGEIVESAVSFKEDQDDLLLIDAAGQIIPDQKAEVMKVRYFGGDKRNVENYSSTAASRILWLLGVPAHTNIMTEKVVCTGCGKDPFRQKSVTKEVTEFKDASIEVKFKAKRIYAPTESPWGWSDVNALSWAPEKQVEIDVMALANHFLGYTSDDRFQNAIVCGERDENDPKICLKPITMTHDIGGAFGDRTKSGLFGGTRPRGDLAAYEKSRIFDNGTCNFKYRSESGTLPKNISRAGRQAFLERAALLTDENLRALFKASHIANLTARNASEVDQITARWARAIANKLAEIKNAPCN